jgi:hypothetical protein
MRNTLLCTLLCATAAWGQPPAASPTPSQRTVVIIADGGGLDAQTLRTLRALVALELRNRGFQVAEDPRLEGEHPANAETRELAASFGGRTFALRIAGRLGSKLPMTLEELAQDGSVTASASHTAQTIEECDVVVPRLAEAMLGHKAVKDTARIATVTAAEARPFRKKPGERFWVFGLPMPLFSGTGGGSQSGFSIGYMYEAEHFGVAVEALGSTNKDQHISTFTLDGFWLPLDGDLSPYFGAGFGYLNTEQANGMGMKLAAGIELFRLHGMRVKAGLEFCLPFFDNSKTMTRYDWNGTSTTFTTQKVSGPSSYGVLHVKVAF